MNTGERRRYGLILIAVLLMGSVILVVGSALYESAPTARTEESAERTTSPGPLTTQQGPVQNIENSPWVTSTTPGDRTLEEFYGRRQYPGSPPIIPHPLPSETDISIGEGCQSCHVKGGYVEKFEAYAPVTPHPDYASCKQCHVPSRGRELFRQNNWKSVSPPKLGRSELPGSPPPIPHELQMRERCVSCHAGPSAVEALRTDHAERGNCTQCHVPRRTTRVWERPGDEK